MRVRYVGLPSGSAISVLAKQSSDGFAAFTAKNGYEVELAAVGNHSAAELIEGKRKSEAILTWILRAVGTGVMFLGFAIFLAPLSTVASVIPILGDLVGGATALVSLAIAAPLSILVIAFAWLTFRPLIGGSLILVALVVGYLLWRWRKSRAAAMPSATPAKAG
jgi:transmembrane protein TMEM43